MKEPEMREQDQCNFAGQDLRNRSFTRKDLRKADFSGANLRGCNFCKACLIGANFNHAQMGRSGFQHALRIGITFCVAVTMTDVVSRLVFGVLGKTWEDSSWPFVILLQGVLAGIGLTSAIAIRMRYRIRKVAQWSAGLLNGALVGFFYGGYLTDSNPRNAAFGAMIGFVVMAVLLRVAGHRPWLKLGVSTASAIAIYGFTFFVGMWAIAAWSTAHYLLAFGLSILSLSSLWLTGHQVLQLLTDFKTFPGTFFQGADLTSTTFENAAVGYTDIGLASRTGEL
jgi:Pentapeptide repeats (8 copies)